MSKIARSKRFSQKGNALTFFGPSAAAVYLPLDQIGAGGYYMNRVSAQSALYMMPYASPTFRGGLFHGGAPYFNGTNYYYTQQAGNTVGASDAHTVSLWLSHERTGGYDQFFFEGSNPKWYLAYYTRSDVYGKDSVQLYIDDSGGNKVNTVFSAASPANAVGLDISGQIWHHVLYTQVGLSERYVYLNGELIGTSTATVGARSYTNMVIGADCTNGPNNPPIYASFMGRIQELLTLRRSVSRQEVKEYYDWARSQFSVYGFDPTYALREAAVHDNKITESLDLTDTTRTHWPVLTQIVREEMNLEDSIGRTERIPPEELTLTDTITTTELDASAWTTDTYPAGGGSTFGLIIFAAPRSLQLRVLFESDIRPTVPSLVHTIWYSPFIKQNVFFEIERLKAWMAPVNLQFMLAKPLFMMKNFSGTALQLNLDIAMTRFMDKRFSFSIEEDGQRLFLSKKLIFSVMPDPSITALRTEYKVLLDGVDVTAKIASCSITYSKSSYVGEIDVTWADYSLYSDIDCSNIARNYMLERLEVQSRLLSNDNPAWVTQGKFFIEKRSTSVAYDSIVPTSWGRTRPAVLAMPYSKPLSKTWDEDTTAKAIAEELCAASELPVTLSWEIADYKILGSNLSVDSTEPIEVISTLAATLGGELSTTKSGVLRVVYKYPVDSQISVIAPQVPDAPEIVQVIAGEGQATVYFT